METFTGVISLEKENNHIIRREFFLAFLFLLFGVLIMGFLMKDNTQQGMNVIRYGKNVSLTKNNFVKINACAAIMEDDEVIIYWKVANQTEKGVFAVMRSDDGINYSCVHMMEIPSNNMENGHYTFEDCAGKCESQYKILFITADNTYTESDKITVTDSSPEFRMMNADKQY